ncbi:MAG TPA: hypothetical protein VNN07_13890 [Candidatus Tectomicrobia bacterium]|nr:hypothetical protein [Candidatus Tectomicrobia bacterium]
MPRAAPARANGAEHVELGARLLHIGPSYAAYGVSFVTVPAPG